MPKLKRRLNAQQPGYGTEISSKPEPFDISQASSSLSMRDDHKPSMCQMNSKMNVVKHFFLISGAFKQNLSLQFNKTASLKLDPVGNSRGLHLNLFNARSSVDIEADVPLERQGYVQDNIRI